ncbi:MAG TPA: alanine racemase [Alphaproteobacteria bacterium]|nr:alanine racemase [Alphaproteobacteria bacterium]
MRRTFKASDGHRMNMGEHKDAILTVDLAAIAANWRTLRNAVAPAACAAVVKADAYGLGMGMVAPALAEAGCRTFYVAQIDEGISLRAILPDADIAVFGGVFSGAEAAFIEHRLIPVLNSLDQIERWGVAAAHAKMRLRAILHVDTGLNRLGLPRDEVDRLVGAPDRLAAFDILAVISHLACSDERQNPMNRRQLDDFNRLRAKLPPARAGIAASSGIYLTAAYHLDEVRPGAALYGVAPQPDIATPVAQVVQLHAKILQVRNVDSTMTVGYGAAYRARRPSRIATVGVGYADGYFRSLGDSGEGYIGEYAAPVVGRISMDLITVDVTDVPADCAHSGASVELLGPHRPVDLFAAQAGTIGYEVLTSLGAGKRVGRRYVGGTRWE